MGACNQRASVFCTANNTEAACQAAASYLHIRPDLREMEENLAFYLAKQPASCQPRRESKLFAAQQRYEERLMDFITDEFAETMVQIPTSKVRTTMRPVHQAGGFWVCVCVLNNRYGVGTVAGTPTQCDRRRRDIAPALLKWWWTWRTCK